MHFRHLFVASFALAAVTAHAADLKPAADTRLTVPDAQLSSASVPAPRLGLLDAQKANHFVQSNSASLSNAVAVEGVATTLTAVQRTVIARPTEARPALAQDSDESTSSMSVAWPLLLGLLVVFLRRAPQRFRSNGL